VPRRPQLASHGSSAACRRSPGAASASKIMPPCAVYFVCGAGAWRWWVVGAAGEDNPGAHRQAQVPCFLNSRGDLGSANAALRLSVSVVAAALWWLKRQAWKEVFVSAALPRCAALRPGRVRGPPRAPSGAAGLLGCARGTVSTLHMVVASCSPPFCALML
jgi:hypothetical protein